MSHFEKFEKYIKFVTLQILDQSIVDLLRYIRARWRFFWLKKRSPKMIYNYIGNDKKIITRTGVSSSTFIDYPHNLQLGKGVYVGHHNFLEASNGLIIEDGCQITNFITITTHSSHVSIRLYGAHYAGGDMIGYVKGKVHIGKYSFIGPHSTIMPDTVIGKGSLVAAYSYVQGHFPDFSIIAGNPAKVVGNTKDKDKSFLNDFPELIPYYDEWSKD